MSDITEWSAALAKAQREEIATLKATIRRYQDEQVKLDAANEAGVLGEDSRAAYEVGMLVLKITCGVVPSEKELEEWLRMKWSHVAQAQTAEEIAATIEARMRWRVIIEDPREWLTPSVDGTYS